MLAGADGYDEGRVMVDGREVHFRRPADAIAHGIGLLPEDRKAQGLVAGLTVAQWIALLAAVASAYALATVLPFSSTYNVSIAVTVSGTPVAVALALGTDRISPFRPVSDVIRAAIAEHVASRRQDGAFQTSLRDRIARAQNLLDG